jgi:cytochrome P450
VSANVWAEALTRSEELGEKWRDEKMGMVVESSSTLALNVISAVAFENHDVNEPAEGHTMSLKEALTTVMSTSISPALEGMMAWINIPLIRILLPRKTKRLMLAMDEFKTYMDELIERERQRTKPEKATGKPMNLIQTLISANTTSCGEKEARISDSELRGNIFIFTVGGLESTSATLTYALLLLSIHPEIQAWVQEEIEQATSLGLEYTKVFPKLVRVKAVMASRTCSSAPPDILTRSHQFETLRLYSPSPPLPRSHREGVLFTVPTSKGNIQLPPKTQVMLNSWPVHASRCHHSSESSPTKWDPKRWISPSGELIHASSFFPWGSGPRICPGMKFSQVEFCAVLVGLVGKVRLVGEKTEVMRVLGGSRADPLLLHVEGEVGLGVEGR